MTINKILCVIGYEISKGLIFFLVVFYTAEGDPLEILKTVCYNI